MRCNVDAIAKELATTRGGYTLWIGAGAAIALTDGRAPSWATLINEASDATGVSLPDGFRGWNPPSQLEWISEKLGHAAFRRLLRAQVVDATLAARPNPEVLKYQAVIGARAGAAVSFNVETVSAFSFAMLRGGIPSVRLYQPRSRIAEEANITLEMTPPAGVAGLMMLFPHGLLDTAGSCVFTESEYRRHGLSLAATVAVNLCLSGDLVILGMSLADRYLRDAILQNRRWIRDVFWFDDRFEFEEWARVADVRLIPIDHARLWSALAEPIVAASPEIRARFDDNAHWDQAAAMLEAWTSRLKGFPAVATERALELLRHPNVEDRHRHAIQEFFENLGVAVPTIV